MNLLQRHPRAATVGAIAIALSVFALLFYLSSLDPEPRGATGTTTEDEDVAAPAPAPGGVAIGAPDGTISESTAGALGLPPEQGAELVLPVDADGDGDSETLVSVRGDGPERPLDWYLLDEGAGEPRVLFSKKGVAHGEISVSGPRFVETEGVYVEGDDPCCPSGFKLTYYVWRDGQLVEAGIEARPSGAPLP